MKKERKLISFILSIALVVAMVPAFSIETFADSDVWFINDKDDNHTVSTFNAAFATEGGIVYATSEGVAVTFEVQVFDGHFSKDGDIYILDLNGCVISGV